MCVSCAFGPPTSAFMKWWCRRCPKKSKQILVRWERSGFPPRVTGLGVFYVCHRSKPDCCSGHCHKWKHNYRHVNRVKNTICHLVWNLFRHLSVIHAVADSVWFHPSSFFPFPLFSPLLWADGTASTWVSSSQKGSQRVFLWWRVWFYLSIWPQ